MQQSEKAELLSKALLMLSAEGWKVGMVTLTMPHHLTTPTDALANALAAGISAAAKVFNSYALPAAVAARSALACMDRNHRGEPAQRALLLETIRNNSLLWLAPSPEVTLGSHGLHPHYHVLVLVPPALQKASWFKGRKVDKYWRLFELENALWDAWTPAVIGALRAGVPRDAQDLYRPSDWSLGVEAVERQQRCDALARSAAPGLEAARAELRQAQLAARPDSRERRDLRGRMVQAVRWSGAVAAAAHYTWGASNEISGAGKTNTLWRTLDHDSTAPLWGRWVASTAGRRLTRSSRGLIGWLEEVAETLPQDLVPPAPEPPVKRVEAHAHPYVIRWARDSRQDAALRLAISQGQESLARWLKNHLPRHLRPLIELRPDRPTPDDADDRDPMRDEAAARILRAAQDLATVGYWVGATGFVAAEERPIPCPKKAAARAYVQSRRKAAALAKDLRGVPAAQITAHSRARLEAAVYDVADRAYGVTP